MDLAPVERRRPASAPPETRRSEATRWVVACSLSEAIGMTAAAAAARGSTALEQAGMAAAWGLALVVLGGVVEGGALGALQSRALPHGLAAGPAARRWLLATVAVAGVGWAAASAPAALASDDVGAEPSRALVLLGAAGLGAVMGAVLGLAQAHSVRRWVSHPWRWVTGSTAGWAVAMPLVFLGATTPGSGWTLPATIGLGTATGLVAGAALGLVTAPFVASLEGPPARHRIVVGLLGSPAAPLLGPGLVGLEVRGSRTGRLHRFPVVAVSRDGELVVLAGGAGRKVWWRNLATEPALRVLRRGTWSSATAEVVAPRSARWIDLRLAYEHAHPGVAVNVDDPFVVLRPRS